MSKLRFGFIGAGQIASYSATEVNNHPDAQVVAAQDTNAERLRELCERHAIAHAHATAEELFANPEVDAVYIAVPNRFHVPLAIQALEAGKHVILEKPFAMSYAEAQEAAAVARKVGKILTLGMNQRFHSSAQSTKALVEANALGEIYHAKAFWFRRTGIPKFGTWFGNKAIAGGGCLYDIGVHMLDLCLHLIGDFEPVSVSGATYGKFGHRGLGEGGWGKSDRSGTIFDVEDFATGLIRFANGTTVSLDVAWACHAEEASRFDVHLYGTEGGAHALEGKFFYRDCATNEYRIIQEGLPSGRYPHGNRFHNFINHLAGKEDLCVTLEQALAVQRILDALAASSATGKEIRFDC